VNVKRTSMAVLVDISPRQGKFHTQEGTKDVIQETLNARMPRYKPVVSLLPDKITVQGKPRQTYLVEVDLDPGPGLMHEPKSVRDVVRNVISQREFSYDPIVILALSPVPSDNKEG
jgi:hypothetical protein